MIYSHHYRQNGFTLIEVMITVVIIGILASIAYPSYQEFVKRGNRTEGQAFLNEVAARQERYYVQNHVYVTGNTDADVAKLKLKNNRTSETGKYTLSLAANAGDGGYTLTATQQFGDTACGNLTLAATGVKGNSGSKNASDCWK
nr:type IV pilin protein [Pseudomonas chengduensis]